ncbi:MAG TPA: fatty acyl-AMP ligase, partial [Ktedonobacterales bacterium]|nr:fatty acyl-AMP ligase [Ktedonobacterales bacterium]
MSKTPRPSSATLSRRTLVDILRWRAEHQPDRIAYTFLLDGETREDHLTFRELDRRARAIAARLQSLGAAGERALLLFPPGLDYVAAFFGCLYAGTIAVPAYPPPPNKPMPRIQAIVSDAQARFALATAQMFASVRLRLAQHPDLAVLQWLATDDLADPDPDAWRRPKITSETLAFLQYTSGSTAVPKGVMVSHGNIMHNERVIEALCHHTDASDIVCWLPMYHDMGLIGNVLQALYLGSRCVLMSPVAFLQKPVRWLQAVSRYRAHTSGGPNFAFDLCASKITPEQAADLDLSHWKVAFSGAEPIHPATLQRFGDAFAPYGLRPEALYPCYGLAEATLMVCGGQPDSLPVVRSFQRAALAHHRVVAADAASDGSEAQALVSSGRTALEQRVTIVDPDTLVPCPPGQVGEIWISGRSVARGYWQRPEQTAETFRARLAEFPDATFLRTGDLGFLDEGELFITGRLKDLIIIRGTNYYPQDIELTAEQSHASLRPGASAAFSIEVADEER